MRDISISAVPPDLEAKWKLCVHAVDVAEAIQRADLPKTPGSRLFGGAEACWLSRNQWLIVSKTLSNEYVLAECKTRLDGLLYSLTEASDALTSIVVEGRHARRLLAMGSCVDFDERAFRHGDCVRTKLARIAVLIRAVGKSHFILDVDRSVAEYMQQWLTRSAEDPILGLAELQV